VPEAIIQLPLVRVRQHLVGLGQLLEPLLGLLVAGIAVGMVFHRQPTISLLYLAYLAATFKAEDLVIVALLDPHITRGTS
jgi:hypothetical protein